MKFSNIYKYRSTEEFAEMIDQKYERCFIVIVIIIFEVLINVLQIMILRFLKHL